MKAIIFDMDGVLVDSEPHHVIIEKKIFAKLGLNITDEEHSTYMGKATDLMWKEIIHDKNLSFNSADLVKQTVEESKIHFAAQTDLVAMSGLVQLLEILTQKGIPMAVASSSGQAIIDILLEKIGVKKYFKHTVSSELVGGSKPEPDIFLHTAKLLEVKPEECLVIEDSTNGIRAAKAANMFCVAYNGGSAGMQNQSLADVQIEDYSELEEIVYRMFNCDE
ncbi:MAG: HAD family phosphatase [Bacteroidetes bacterium]|nr:HAD family phosphatase [Bacteroidota bacterium]